MRFLALDYGNKHTGLAIGEDSSILELPPVSTTSTQFLLLELKKIIDAESIVGLIVGVPNYKDTKQKNKTSKFIETLRSNFNLPIYEVDEYGTSKESFSEMFTKHSAIKKIKHKIHSTSAAKILERFWMLGGS